MKLKLFVLLLTVSSILSAQHEHACATGKQQSEERTRNLLARSAQANPNISHELRYDVKFVHLNLNLERNTKYISGNVRTVATVTSNVLDTFMCILHQVFTIDSIKINNSLVSFIRQDSSVKCKVTPAFNSGTSFTTQVYYKGTAPTGGSAIGSGFSTGTSGSWGNQATWSLSESFVAYHWWPCKQSLTDKIDSSWVFVTTDSLNKVGSNGLLKNVILVGNKKRYEWKSRYPIDYYLISVAVAKYKEYRQYAKPQYLANDSILLQNYIYDGAINNNNWITGQKVALDKMPQVLNFLSNMYGMYPFYKEKYGHCMAPFSGGMEHQTMTSLGFFDYYIDAHELGHQWWGDQVTCKTWGDIWINEGFASYTEHLVAQYLDPINFAANLTAAHNAVMAQPGGSVFFTGSDTMSTSRIFSSRLSYDKGGAIIHSLRFLTNNDSLWFQTLRGFQNTYKNSTASAIDFQNYYQSTTGINPSVFFNQWYYGQGYPTFAVRFHQRNGNLFVRSTQTTSFPSSIATFSTPVQYGVSRVGKPDTLIRLQHNLSIENYTLALSGTVTGMSCDPQNWLINKSTVSRDTTLGYVAPPPIDPNPAALFNLEGYSKITAGPNPVRSSLFISNPAHSSGLILLRDLQGKLLLTQNLDSVNELNFAAYAGGVYLIIITDENGQERWTQKVIKKD